MINLRERGGWFLFLSFVLARQEMSWSKYISYEAVLPQKLTCPTNFAPVLSSRCEWWELCSTLCSFTKKSIVRLQGTSSQSLLFGLFWHLLTNRAREKL